MKKICGVSLVALLVGASFNAYANIASTGYVDTEVAKKVDKNTAITAGTATKITYDAKGLVTAGANLSASDIPSLMAAKITDFGTKATESANSAIATSIASGDIKTELNKKVDVSSVTDTYSATGTAPVNGKAVASAISGKANSADVYTKTQADTAFMDSTEVSSAITTAIANKADKATTLSGYGITNAYTKTEVNTELAKKQDVANIVLNGTSETGDDANKYPSVQKATAIANAAVATAAGNYAAKSTQTAVENATTGLAATYKLASEALQNASVTGDGNVITTVSEDASHNLVATKGLTAVTTVTPVTTNGSVIKSVTQNGATVTMTGGKIVNADITDATIEKGKLASGVQTSLGKADSAVQTVSTTGTTGVVKTVSANTSGTVTVTRAAIENADIADNAAIAMSKIAMPDSTVAANVNSNGTYVLTLKVDNGVKTYSWENITR